MLLLVSFYCSLLDSSLDSFGPCAEQRKRPDDTDSPVYEGNPIDIKFPSHGIADVGIIWDTSIYAFRDTSYLKVVRVTSYKIIFKMPLPHVIVVGYRSSH